MWQILSPIKKDFARCRNFGNGKLLTLCSMRLILQKKAIRARGFASLEEHFAAAQTGCRRIAREPQRQTSFETELNLANKNYQICFCEPNAGVCRLQMLKDAIVSYGEQLSSRLLAEVCKAAGVNARQIDSRRVIVTDEEYGSAKPIWDETEKFIQLELNGLLEKGEVPIMGGFIAANRSGETTTLGRGGSDYSAALVGAALKCERNSDLDGCNRRFNLRSANLFRCPND